MGTIRITKTKSAIAALGMAALVGLPALPASAADPTAPQVVTGTLGAVISISTAPTATVDFGNFAATGPNTASGGSIGVTSNVPYTLSVKASRAKMSQYSGGYVADGAQLTAPLSVVAVASSGTGAGVAVPAIGTADAPVATGLLSGTDVFALTLSQVTSLTDVKTTYRSDLTYTATPTLT